MLIASALLLLAGCATESATPDSSTTAPDPSTPSAEPSPVAQPKIPFDGDCGLALSADAVSGIFDGRTPVLAEPEPFAPVMPDLAATAELGGGLACTWSTDDANLRVVVLPAAAVADDIVDARAEFGCQGWGFCGRGEVHDGMWVHAETFGSAYADPTPEESAALEQTVDTALASLSEQPSEQLAGVAVPRAAEWWVLDSCDAIESVAAAAGMASPTPGYPSDSVPSGPLWEALAADGAVAWCPWHESTSGGTILTEVYVQPGIGAPSDAHLAAAGAEAITISGADSAYRIPEDAGSARSFKVVAVVGPNRLTVSGDAAEAVAAAAITALAR